MRAIGSFHVADIQRECPGVITDTIRCALEDMQASEKIQCLGRGQNARWQKIEK